MISERPAALTAVICDVPRQDRSAAVSFVPTILFASARADSLAAEAFALRRQALNVTIAGDGVEAVRRWASDNPDLVLIDAALPGLDGVEVCRRIRQSARTPVILLGEARDDASVVPAFRAGADDYVVRPASARQIALRIYAVLRRYQRADRDEPTILQAGPYTVDLEAHQVRKGDRTIQLTPIEFRIFWLLAANHGRGVSFNRLIEHGWGRDGGDARSLNTHLTHIRRKLGMADGQPGSIAAMPGVGYVLTR